MVALSLTLSHMCALRLGGRSGLAKGGTGAKDSKYLYSVPHEAHLACRQTALLSAAHFLLFINSSTDLLLLQISIFYSQFACKHKNRHKHIHRHNNISCLRLHNSCQKKTKVLNNSVCLFVSASDLSKVLILKNHYAKYYL